MGVMSVEYGLSDHQIMLNSSIEGFKKLTELFVLIQIDHSLPYGIYTFNAFSIKVSMKY